MSDEQATPTATTPSPEGTEQAGGETETALDQSLSAAELDEQWRNRMSQRDKAHAAELKALRERNEATERSLQEFRTRQEQQRLAGMSEAERVAAERDQLRQELEAERQARVIDTRKARFPHIAAELDDQSIAVMDEGKLAALNTRLSVNPASVEPPSLIDPNSAARTMANPPTAPGEKSSEALKADLAAMGPAFSREIGGTLEP